MFRTLLVTLAISSTLLGFASSARADFVFIPVAEDTAPYSFLPSQPRGNSATLYAFRAFDENSTPHDFETYLWFDVAQSDLPAGHVLVEATLLVTYAFDFTGFGETSNVPGQLECREVLEPWSPASLTWSNRPDVGPPFDTITGITGFGAQLCDATDLVLDWIGNRSPNEGIALVNPTARVIGMNALEAAVDASLKPQLILRTELPEPGLAAALATGSVALTLARRRRPRPALPSGLGADRERP